MTLTEEIFKLCRSRRQETLISSFLGDRRPEIQSPVPSTAASLDSTFKNVAKVR
jgi:hypothetical protein